MDLDVEDEAAKMMSQIFKQNMKRQESIKNQIVNTMND